MLIVIVAIAVSQSARAAEKVEFNRDIRPILSDYCFACHGPDKKHRKADLRLDQEDGVSDAFGESSLEDNEAWQRLISTDDKKRMPPPKAHKWLNGKQKKLLAEWIQQGAPYA